MHNNFFSRSLILALLLYSYSPSSSQNFVNLSSDDVTTWNSASLASAWADYDLDGFDDLYVCNYANLNNFLFHNNGDGSFTRVAGLNITEDQANTYSATWGDFNNDGYPDLFLANYNEANHLYINNGGVSFTKVLIGDIVNDIASSWDASWVDYNNDGNLDMFVATNNCNLLYKNLGDGTFEKITSGAIPNDNNASFACAWGDYNNDGFQDLFVANYGNQNNTLYENLDGENFQKITVGSLVNDGGQSRSVSLGDYDNDGFLDVYFTNSGQVNFLYKNNGDETFDKIINDPIVSDSYWSYSSTWNDYNNDGYLDMFVVNSTSTDSVSLFMNNQNGTFSKVKDPSIIAEGSSSWGLSSSDFDKDGFTDVFVASRGVSNSSYLFNNLNFSNSYLGISLEGRTSNWSGYGARAMVKIGDTWITRYSSGSTGRGSQNSAQLIFGLENQVKADSVKVIWPASGTSQMFTDVSANRFIHITEGIDEIENNPDGFTNTNNLPLTENGDNSWASAWGDYNDDGDIDLYVSNYFGENYLYKNNGDKTFEKITDLTPTIGSEQSWSSVWVDCDNDYDLDLYVVNGYTQDNRLYLNKGDGTFIGASSPITNTSDINANNASWVDYDNDGDLDLFIANGSNANSTTRNENNSFYVNEGNAVFTKNTSSIIANDGGFSQLGSWGDYDNDGDVDLLVLNTFQDNFFYENNGDGSFTKVLTVPFLDTGEQPLSASWGDFDRNGFLDVLIGSFQDTRLYLNNGDKSFEAVEFPGLSGNVSGTTVSDFDNDGDLDVVFVRVGQASLYYLNNGNGSFIANQGNDLGITTLGFTNTGAIADYDNDGDLDIFINNDDDPNILMENNGNANNWIRIKLRGGSSNAYGIGAKVRIKSGGIWQMRELSVLSAYRSQDATEASFGLGSNHVIDSVLVEWPLGITQVLVDVTVNQILTIQEEVNNPYFKKLTNRGNTPVETNYSRGSQWVDYNNDGYEDLFVINNNSSSPEPDFLFRNNQDGTFTQISSGSIVNDLDRSNSGSWADYDNDGDIDLCLSIHGELVLYVNDGNGNFTKTSGQLDRIYNRSILDVAWADYDNDGLLDLYGTDHGLENELFRNLGTSFERVVLDDAVKDQDRSYSVAFGDYDNDGDLDLFVSNRQENSAFYENNGDGSFTKKDDLVITQDGDTYAFSSSWADFNNDGHLDLFVATNAGNTGYTNFLYKNNGDKTFSLNTSIVSQLSANSAGSAWADFNNDGFIDLFVANQNGRNNLYLNNGDETFTDVQDELVVIDNFSSAGPSWSDFDLDGDQDLFVPNLLAPNSFYVNNGNDNNWISLLLEGAESNKSAIGARVTLYDENGLQIREISSHTGYRSQNSIMASFGLGTSDLVDSLVIRWPSGNINVLEDIGVNQILEIIEGANQAPILSLIGDKVIAEGSTLSFTVSATDIDIPVQKLSYDLDAASESLGMLIDENTGEFSWTPSESQEGSYNVTISVSDGELEDSETIEIVIEEINEAPVLASVANKVITEGSTLSFMVSATDIDIPVQDLSYSLDAVLESLGMLIDGNTGEFSWTPSESQDGSYEVTINVTDGELGNSETIEIVVEEINEAPVLASVDNKVIAEGSTLSFTVSATDIDIPVQELSYSLDALSQSLGMSIDPSTGEFSWTPSESQDGSHEVTISVTDGEFEDSETIEVVVEEVNEAPALTSVGNKVIAEGSTLSFTVSATDEDIPVQELGYSLDAVSESLGMSIDENTGEFSWTPSESQEGSYNVTISVSDGEFEDSETIEVIAEEVNEAPLLTLVGNKVIAERSTLSFTVSATDEDIPVQELSYGLDAASENLGMSIDEDTGEFSWTPSESQDGSYEVTISVSDGELEDSETIEVVVEEVNEAPLLTLVGNKVIAEGSTLSFTVSATDIDIPVQELSYSLDAVSAGLGMSIDPSTGEFSWTPSESQDGSHEVTINVTDGEFEDSEIIGVVVEEVNKAPALTSVGNKVIAEGSTLSFTVSATDADIPTQELGYSLDAVSESLGMLIDENTGEFNWTPTESQDGSYNVTISVSDGELEGSEIIEVVVEEVNEAPVLTSVGDKLIAEGATLSFTVLLTDVDIPVQDISYRLDAVSEDLGMSIDPSTGEFSWTPTESQDGSYNVTISVSDGELEDSETIEVVVEEMNEAPVFTPVGDKVIAEGSTLSFTLSATDADIPVQDLSYRLDAVSESLSMTIDENTGEFSWTPLESQDGSYNVSVNVSDGELEDNTSFSISVSIVNSNPVLTINTGLRVKQEQGNVITDQMLKVVDSDDEDFELTFQIMNSPDHGILKRGARELLEGDTFTQNDINEELITYRYDGEAETDEVLFSLTDSEGAFIDNIRFEIFIEIITSIEEEANAQVELYPNPFSEVLNLEFSNSYIGPYLVSLIDSKGVKYLEIRDLKSKNNKILNLSLKKLPQQIYYLIVQFPGSEPLIRKVSKME